VLITLLLLVAVEDRVQAVLQMLVAVAAELVDSEPQLRFH
jgi:hypothetical protein